MGKYKLTWKDLSWNDFKVYLFTLFKAFIPKKKITNLDELESFIQSKSAWVTQVTLYGYLKTRMGTRYVLHFENDEFMKSVNLAKWNIYVVALQDLIFYIFSYLKTNLNYQDVHKAEEIFLKILDDETTNKMPLDIIEEAKKNFNDFGFYLKSGIEMISAIIVGLLIGLFLDSYFETKPLFLILFLILGFASGILSVFRTVKKLGFEVGFKKKNDKLH